MKKIVWVCLFLSVTSWSFSDNTTPTVTLTSTPVVSTPTLVPAAAVNTAAPVPPAVSASTVVNGPAPAAAQPANPGSSPAGMVPTAAAQATPLALSTLRQPPTPDFTAQAQYTPMAAQSVLTPNGNNNGPILSPQSTTVSTAATPTPHPASSPAMTNSSAVSILTPSENPFRAMDKSSLGKSNNGFYMNVGGGMDIPAQNWQAAYSSGAGENISVGFGLGDNWAVQLTVDNFYFTGVTDTSAITDNELRIVPTLKYFILPGDIRPYFLLGTGMDIETGTTLTGASGIATVTSWDMVAGLGFEFELENHLALFLEGKCNFVMADGPNNTTVTGLDIPVLAGLRLGL